MPRGKYEPTALEKARDELFSHIMRCGVLDAETDQRTEWMSDTVQYLAERYPALTHGELDQLKQIGHRYCQPAIPHGPTDARAKPAETGGSQQTDEVSVA
ncbi:MAG: hypothetical protein ACE5JR_07860 [Gemmatimonadota bacterium]